VLGLLSVEVERQGEFHLVLELHRLFARCDSSTGGLAILGSDVRDGFLMEEAAGPRVGLPWPSQRLMVAP
jgi:hypothetical protein